MDAKAYGNEPIPVGIAFEEQDTEVNGKLGSDRESWGIRPGG